MNDTPKVSTTSCWRYCIKNKEENGTMGLFDMYLNNWEVRQVQIIRGTLAPNWCDLWWDLRHLHYHTNCDNFVQCRQVQFIMGSDSSIYTDLDCYGFLELLSQQNKFQACSRFKTLALDSGREACPYPSAIWKFVIGLFVLEFVCLSVFEVLVYDHVALPFIR